MPRHSPTSSHSFQRDFPLDWFPVGVRLNTQSSITCDGYQSGRKSLSPDVTGHDPAQPTGAERKHRAVIHIISLTVNGLAAARDRGGTPG